MNIEQDQLNQENVNKVSDRFQTWVRKGKARKPNSNN